MSSIESINLQHNIRALEFEAYAKRSFELIYH